MASLTLIPAGIFHNRQPLSRARRPVQCFYGTNPLAVFRGVNAKVRKWAISADFSVIAPKSRCAADDNDYDDYSAPAARYRSNGTGIQRFGRCK